MARNTRIYGVVGLSQWAGLALGASHCLTSECAARRGVPEFARMLSRQFSTSGWTVRVLRGTTTIGLHGNARAAYPDVGHASCVERPAPARQPATVVPFLRPFTTHHEG
jgi:hypothetical protein